MSKHIICNNFDILINKVKTYITDKEDLELIENAYNYAYDKHFGQKRLTGEDYITHPLSVAYIVTGVQADASTIAGALLHDIISMCEFDRDDFKEIFGEDILSLVEGFTKINKLNLSGDSEAIISNQRKILVGLSEDVRVIILKLADRLHNMRTLFVLDEKKQKETAKETLDILTPIAHRLGMNSIKTELEELSLRYLKPDEYYEIAEELNASKAERDKSVAKMIESVSELLNKHNIKHEIKGRSKSIYSIYKKLAKGKKFSEIYDLLALRVFVDTEEECYQALGIIHSKFKPKPNRFKDYIAMPKTNMYRSLHTTVFGIDGELYEIQIRTYEMDMVAENGIASHWSYKEHGSGKVAIQSDMEQKLQFFKSIMELKRTDANSDDVVTALQEDILKKTIYVFTPLGDVIELPSGATPIDFAYKVHTKVGDTMTGAIVNSVMVPLEYELKSDDVVKIITSNNSSGPNRQWLNIAKTTQARNKIKNFFNKQDKDDNVKNGEIILNKELKKRKISNSLFDSNLDKILSKIKLGTKTEMYSNLGSGKLSVDTIFDALNKEEVSKEEKMLEKAEKLGNKVTDKKSAITVDGFSDIKINIASCCNPVRGDKITGYITKGSGVSVHRSMCPNIANITERIINVSWNDTDDKYLTNIIIYFDFSKNVLLNVVTKATNDDIGVLNVITTKNSSGNCIEMSVLVKDSTELSKFMNDIRMIEGVTKVERFIK